ncbi:MAG: sodium:solute symporter family protein [Ignavibacteriales bacterium]|nr:sodium:solute symporter family protein [Ignavibacteriales bacterium]
MTFSLLDGIIVLLYVAAAVWAGISVRRRVRTISDFLVAGRRLRYHLGVATLVATELGLVTMMYFAEQGFRFGFAAFIIGVIWATAYLVIAKTGFVVDRLRMMEIMTITEFFGRRYSKGVRILAASLLIVAGILSLGVFLKLGAVFIVHFLGIPETSIHVTTTILLIVVLAYTALGGMISVVLTDFIQFIFLAIGMVLTTMLVLSGQGFVGFFDQAMTAYGAAGFDPIDHPEYGWWFIAYWSVFAVSGCLLWQPVAQRILSSEHPGINRFIFRSTGMMFLGRAFFPIVWGIGAALMFGLDSDASAGMPRLLAEILPVGLLGLLTAGMFAAMMSTDSSYILAWSSIIVQDFLDPLRKHTFTDSQRLQATRWSIGIIGLLMLVFGIWYELKDTAFRYLLDVTTVYYAGGLPAIVLGLYWKCSTTAGAYAAFIGGALLPLSFVIEDILLQAGGSTGQGFIATLMPPNVRGFTSFALGFAGLFLGSLLSSRTSQQPGH